MGEAASVSALESGGCRQRGTDKTGKPKGNNVGVDPSFRRTILCVKWLLLFSMKKRTVCVPNLVIWYLRQARIGETFAISQSIIRVPSSSSHILSNLGFYSAKVEENPPNTATHDLFTRGVIVRCRCLVFCILSTWTPGKKW